jgi:hypothetical protein
METVDRKCWRMRYASVTRLGYCPAETAARRARLAFKDQQRKVARSANRRNI